MGLERGYCKETVQIMSVQKQSSEETFGWKKGVLELQCYIIYAGMAR